MQRYWLISILLCAFFLLIFLLTKAVDIPVVVNPLPWLETGGALAALIGVGLLISDLVLPIPSSLIMLAHGAIFGTLIGTCLSLAGSTGAMLLGFAIGRSGGPLLGRILSQEERVRANRMLKQWGMLAIIVSRPVPLVAETVSIMAGSSDLGCRRATLAAIAGSLPCSFLYALAGDYSLQFEYGVLIFGSGLTIAGLLWLVSRRIEITSVKEE